MVPTVGVWYNRNKPASQKEKGGVNLLQLVLETKLHQFATCSEFIQAFQVGEEDLIFTSDHLYRDYLAPLNLGCRYLLRNSFGGGEPTDLMVEAILSEAAKAPYRRLIAIGGGSVIDVAKVLAVADGPSVDALYDQAPQLKKHCQLVIVPTTCGTGSEVTNISILNRTRLGTKMGLVGSALFPDDAVLIPQLLEGLPFTPFATSSIDALVHAVESALSPKATPFSKLFSYKAIEMILSGYRTIAAQGQEARRPLLGDFLVASTFAGCAFGTAGCAAVHALSYPLGGQYHVPHGESNYAMFSGVMDCYLQIKQDGEIAVLSDFLAKVLDCPAEQAFQALEQLLGRILPQKPLHAYGVTRDDLAAFTDTVMATQSRLMGNSFVPLTREQVYQIYETLF